MRSPHLLRTDRLRGRLQRGFTMIELMITVTILGVIAALAAPNLLPLVNQAQLQAYAETVAGAVDATRREAVAAGRCARLRLEDTDRLHVEVLASPDCVNLTNASAWDTRRTMELQDVELTFESTTMQSGLTGTNDHAVIFRPSGRLLGDALLDVTDDAARVVVTRSSMDANRVVNIMSHGRVCTAYYGTTPPAINVTNTTCPD